MLNARSIEHVDEGAGLNAVFDLWKDALGVSMGPIAANRAHVRRLAILKTL